MKVLKERSDRDAWDNEEKITVCNYNYRIVITVIKWYDIIPIKIIFEKWMSEYFCIFLLLVFFNHSCSSDSWALQVCSDTIIHVGPPCASIIWPPSFCCVDIFIWVKMRKDVLFSDTLYFKQHATYGTFCLSFIWILIFFLHHLNEMQNG